MRMSTLIVLVRVAIHNPHIKKKTIIQSNRNAYGRVAYNWSRFEFIYVCSV